ncbi:MAG TPA: histidine phosphatase family protein [Gaiellaceae bacterium]|jgi:phosphohistidine phosphatase
MPSLYVLRHAKSSWDDPALADAERPLAPRGRKAARRLGRHLSDEGIRPALVLCSPAVRARETLARIGPALAEVETLVERGLYGASASDLIERLRAVPDDVPSVLVIGHNPALQTLVVRLARPGQLRDRAAVKLPTGALATLELDGGWNALTDGCAELAKLLLPRELA